MSDLEIVFIEDKRTLELNLKLNEKVLYILDENLCSQLDNMYFSNKAENTMGVFHFNDKKAVQWYTRQQNRNTEFQTKECNRH